MAQNQTHKQAMEDWAAFRKWECEVCLKMEPQYLMARLNEELLQEWGQITQKYEFMLSLRAVQASLRAIASSRSRVRRHRAARDDSVRRAWSSEATAAIRQQELQQALMRALEGFRTGVENIQAFQHEQGWQAATYRPNSNERSRQYTAKLLRDVRDEIAEMQIQLDECREWLRKKRERDEAEERRLREEAEKRRLEKKLKRAREGGDRGQGAPPSHSHPERSGLVDQNQGAQRGGEQGTGNEGGGGAGVGAPGGNYGDGGGDERRPPASRHNTPASDEDDDEEDGEQGNAGNEESLPDYEWYEQQGQNDVEANGRVHGASEGQRPTPSPANTDLLGNLERELDRPRHQPAPHENQSRNLHVHGASMARQDLQIQAQGVLEDGTPSGAPRRRVQPSRASQLQLRNLVHERDFGNPAAQAAARPPLQASQIAGASRNAGSARGATANRPINDQRIQPPLQIGAGAPGDPGSGDDGSSSGNGSGHSKNSKGPKRRNSGDDHASEGDGSSHKSSRREKGPDPERSSPTSPDDVHQQASKSAAAGATSSQRKLDEALEELQQAPAAILDYVMASLNTAENGIPHVHPQAIFEMVYRLRKAYGDDWDWESAPPIGDFLTPEGQERRSMMAMKKLRQKETWIRLWEDFFAQNPGGEYYEAIAQLCRTLQAGQGIAGIFLRPPRWREENDEITLLARYRQEALINEGANIEDSWTAYFAHVEVTQGIEAARAARLAFLRIQKGRGSDSQPHSPANPQDRLPRPPLPPPPPPPPRRESSIAGIPGRNLDRAAAEAQRIGFDNPDMPGIWTFLGTLGGGGYGHAGLWAKYDASWRILMKTVVKETYLGKHSWNDSRYWEGQIDPTNPAEERFPRERHIHSLLQPLHESFNVVTAFGDTGYPDRYMYRIYMEYCEHGDLENLLQNHKDLVNRAPTDQHGHSLPCEIPILALWCIFEALVSAVCLMRYGCLPGSTPPENWGGAIFHRDIKPCNVFLASPDEVVWRSIPVPKLGDFGLAVQKEAGNVNRRPSQSFGVGTPGYMAPEAVSYPAGALDFVPRYSSASDVYAIGKTMMCLMNLDNDPSVKQFDYMYRLFQPTPNAAALQKYPRDLIDLVIDCVNPDPDLRRSVDMLWWKIRDAVYEAPPALRGLPLKFRALGDDDILRYAPDRYAQWAK